ncbi:mannosyltransferase family protein [Cupriavidus alkaliphilus]|uniref:mannosyltransferase family protein n=1 Tax=Cupriavidus alkaliphilus TaxID=942866 RepID=UPI000B033772|nr:mannosyltransferase family protein [Cupriavidus alkaliphilus]
MSLFPRLFSPLSGLWQRGWGEGRAILKSTAPVGADQHHPWELLMNQFYVAVFRPLLLPFRKLAGNSAAGQSDTVPGTRAAHHTATAIALATVVLCWFLGRGLVFGTLANVEQLTGHYAATAFTWASPASHIKPALLADAGALELTGRAPHDQRWTIGCSNAFELVVERPAGLFRQLVPVTPDCGVYGLSIRSDWSMVPGDGTGGRDPRQLSFQLFDIRTSAGPIPLTQLVEQSSGFFAVEKFDFGTSAEHVLTSRWDADWYRRIASAGYHYDGDSGRQQSVAWPFLYPMIVKALAALLGKTVTTTLLAFNAACLLLSMVLLFVIGRAAGLDAGPALIAPAWLVFNPFAFFLVGGFSESLFLLLECAVVLSLLYRRYWIAAAAIALLTATRFVGLLAVVWLIHGIWSDKASSPRKRVLRSVAVAGIASLGIVGDMAVKWMQTGFPLAAFTVRKAWQVTPSAQWLGTLDVGRLFEGDYLAVVFLVLVVFLYCIAALCKAIQQSCHAAVLLIGAGVTLVGGTLLLNPELHSVGRYLLPLAPSIVGVLVLDRAHGKLLACLGVIMAAGAGAMPFIVQRIAMGWPPY